MYKRIILLTSILFSLNLASQNIGLEERELCAKISPHAKYVRYEYIYHGLPILEHQGLRIFNKDGSLIKQKSSLSNEALGALTPNLQGPHLLWRKDKWLSVFADTINNGKEHSVRFISSENQVVDEIDLNLHYTDTTVQVRVFNPDPLSPNGYSYGGIYTDMNDGNANVLDSLTAIRNVTVDKVNNTVYLRNQYLEVIDFDSPNISISQNPSQWLSGRTSDEFEQVMVAYHITEQNKYLEALGYDSILNYAIHVDPQALNGQDNSMFNWGTTPPRLFFGEGGVDDAEDADVIIHELGHAISHGAAPGTTIGTERRTFDEALGDYFAERYGRLLGVTSSRIFDWDGNNTFWNGRSAIYDGSKNYNNLTFLSIYQHTDLMVSAMLEFSASSNVNDSTADKIVLESLYQLMSYESLRDIAENMISADSLITGGSNFTEIHNAFGAPKNILAPLTLDEKIDVSTPKIYYGKQSYVLLPKNNSYTFKIYNLNGQILDSGTSMDHILLPGGQLIVHVADEQGNITVLKKL